MQRAIKQSLGASADYRKLFLVLLTPSWLSGLAAVVISIAVMLTTVIALHFPGSSLQLLLNDRSVGASPSLSNGSLVVNNNFSANELVSDTPLFILWGCVGLLTYSFITSIASALGNAGELMAELTFAHVKRGRLLRQALERVLVRVAALVAWVLLAEFTIHVVLPYAIAATQFASSAVGLLSTIFYAALALSVLVVCWHLHVVLLRLMLLRPRVFGQSEYV